MAWVDYDLLKRLADNEKIQLILIGIEHDDSLKNMMQDLRIPQLVVQ